MNTMTMPQIDNDDASTSNDDAKYEFDDLQIMSQIPQPQMMSQTTQMQHTKESDKK